MQTREKMYTNHFDFETIQLIASLRYRNVSDKSQHQHYVVINLFMPDALYIVY